MESEEGWTKLAMENEEEGCTAKERKEGAVNSNFIIGISYHCGILLGELYFGEDHVFCNSRSI